MKRLLLVAFTGFSLLMLFPTAVSAVDPFDDVCSKQPDAAVCKDNAQVRGDGGAQQNPLFGKEGILTKIISLISTIAGIIAVIVIILAGLKFMTSGSNPQDANNAREMVIYAAVGLVIAASAQLIVRFFLNQIGAGE